MWWRKAAEAEANDLASSTHSRIERTSPSVSLHYRTQKRQWSRNRERRATTGRTCGHARGGVDGRRYRHSLGRQRRHGYLKDRDMDGILRALDHSRQYLKGRKTKTIPFLWCPRTNRAHQRRNRLRRVRAGRYRHRSSFRRPELKRQMVADIEARSDGNAPSAHLRQQHIQSSHRRHCVRRKVSGPRDRNALLQSGGKDATGRNHRHRPDRPCGDRDHCRGGSKDGQTCHRGRRPSGLLHHPALAPYMIESMFLALEGYALPDIDAAAMSSVSLWVPSRSWMRLVLM